jgi:hypothetical protein
MPECSFVKQDFTQKVWPWVQQRNEIAERDFIVYPNPAENEVFIQNFQSGKSLVSVFNSTGQMVLNSTFNQPGVHTLSVNELSSGIYTIQVGRITKRLLIK